MKNNFNFFLKTIIRSWTIELEEKKELKKSTKAFK